MNLLNPTANLAPGFRFHPTETELITFYLNRKINRVPIEFNPIADIDLYKYSPWKLPELSNLKIRHEKQWFFFNSLDRKYDGSRRSNRATADGFWKSTGKDRPIYEETESKRIIGMKKILVFHVGRAPNGKRTDWVMHEYRGVEDAEIKDNRASFVLCRIFHKSSIGREKMDQCGSRYVKEEWEDAHDSSESDTNGLVDADGSDQKTDVIFLAPGFRFRPTDEELVGYYLKRKVMGLHLRVDAIPEINIYKSAPWDLPSLTRVSLTVPNKEGYFFSILDRKYSQNHSTINNRATAEGYWKSTGNDCPVLSHLGGKKMGMKKFLVFHTGRAPRSQRTDWVMHEYRLEEDEQNSVMCGKGSTFVVCKIFQKKSFGEQKGRPRSVDPTTEETDEGEIVPVDVLDCAPNPTTDGSPNVTTAVCTPIVNEAMFAPMVTEENFAPKVTQAHAAQNAELIEVVQKKIHAQASKEVQQGKAQSLYKVGNHVEIAYMRQQIPVAWYTASVIKVQDEQVLLVEYETLKAKDNSLLSELVSIQYIRPHPPVREVEHFKVLAEVEAYYNGGWWPGVVATVHDNAKYNVKFMHLEEEIEFDHKELRLLYDWVDGKWVQASQENKTLESLNHEELRTVEHTQLLHSNNQDHKRKLSHSNGCEIGITSEFTITSNMENKNGKEIAIKSQHEVFQQFKKAKIEENVEDPFSEENNEELVLELSLPGYKGGKIHEDRKKKKDNCIPRTVESSLNVGLLSKIQENNKSLELSTSSDNSSEAQGLSNPLTSSSDASLVESSTSSVKPRFDKLPLEQPSLPFEKHSSLWDTLENMEVFHTMPQNPHFAPLGQHGEAFREGMAIGLMLTFSNVVAGIEKLDATDSVEKLALIYKTLIELEAHGFEVQCLRARLMELLKVKRNKEKLDDDVSSLEDLIGKNGRVDLNLKLDLEVKSDVSS